MALSNPSRFAALLLAAFAAVGLVVAFGMTGCGAQSKTAGQAFIHCEEAAIAAKVPQLLPTVESILSSGVADSKAQLEALAQYAGEESLACAVQTAAAVFAKPKVGGPVQGDAGARDRANEAISLHNWKFSPGPGSP